MYVVAIYLFRKTIPIQFLGPALKGTYAKGFFPSIRSNLLGSNFSGSSKLSLSLLTPQANIIMVVPLGIIFPSKKYYQYFFLIKELNLLSYSISSLTSLLQKGTVEQYLNVSFITFSKYFISCKSLMVACLSLSSKKMLHCSSYASFCFGKLNFLICRFDHIEVNIVLLEFQDDLPKDRLRKSQLMKQCRDPKKILTT